MKNPTIFLIAILIFTLSINTVGQESPKAVLVDEFGKPDCETLWSRLDNLAIEMKERPDTIATVDISGESKDPRVAFYWDSMIRGYFVRYKIPKERWTVRRGTLGEEWRVQFWLSPPGALQPEFNQSEWRMTYSSETKPFVFTNGESYSVEVGVCLYVDEVALLAEALEHNPDARVNVVLIVRSDREVGCSDLRGRIDNFLQSIVNKQGVRGVVVTLADRERKVSSVHREELIKAQVNIRKFPLSRIEFQRAVYNGELKTQFWSIPDAIAHSAIKDHDDSYSLGWIATPFLILVDDEYNEGECYDIDEPQILSQILKENAGSRLNIVFYGSTANELKSREQRMLRRFTLTNGIDRKRIRTFLNVIRRNPEHPMPTEYWYLPTKKK